MEECQHTARVADQLCLVPLLSYAVRLGDPPDEQESPETSTRSDAITPAGDPLDDSQNRYCRSAHTAPHDANCRLGGAFRRRCGSPGARPMNGQNSEMVALDQYA